MCIYVSLCVTDMVCVCSFFLLSNRNTVKRAQMTRINSKFITSDAFAMRKVTFVARTHSMPAAVVGREQTNVCMCIWTVSALLHGVAKEARDERRAAGKSEKRSDEPDDEPKLDARDDEGQHDVHGVELCHDGLDELLLWWLRAR